MHDNFYANIWNWPTTHMFINGSLHISGHTVYIVYCSQQNIKRLYQKLYNVPMFFDKCIWPIKPVLGRYNHMSDVKCSRQCLCGRLCPSPRCSRSWWFFSSFTGRWAWLPRAPRASRPEPAAVTGGMPGGCSPDGCGGSWTGGPWVACDRCCAWSCCCNKCREAEDKWVGWEVNPWMTSLNSALVLALTTFSSRPNYLCITA